MLSAREGRSFCRQGFAQMIRTGQIENCVADFYRQFFVLSEEFPGQWVIFGFDNYTVSDPLPKL